MGLLKKLKYPLMAAAAAAAAPYAIPALGGLLGMGGAAGAAGAAEGGGLLAGELASQALPSMLPEAVMPAMESMTPMTFPYGEMPAEDLIISGLESGRQGALDPSMMQLAQRGMAQAKGLLGNDKMGYAAMMMAQSGGQRPPPMQSAPPQRQEFGPTALTPQEKRRRQNALGSYLYG